MVLPKEDVEGLQEYDAWQCVAADKGDMLLSQRMLEG
jgi:hypothetical protein